jgi:hypothetical protein
LASDQDSPIFTSRVAGIIGMYHHAWPKILQFLLTSSSTFSQRDDFQWFLR